MNDLSAHQFEETYKNLGISLNSLGCIMLDVEPLQVSDIIAESDLYYSSSPEYKYVSGVVSEDVPHVTLLYGLLRSGPEMRRHVNAVLTNWVCTSVEVERVTYFDSRYKDEPYYCLVAELLIADRLLEGNARLRMLPHIDTFPTYRAHITLAYIKQDESIRDSYVAQLSGRFAGKKVRVVGLNYGN